MPGSYDVSPSSDCVPQCSKITPWGQCRQPSWASSTTGLCRSHETWTTLGKTPDKNYHEKIARGLLEPTWAYMSDAEIDATVNGRYRGDGRRLDQYIIDDPLGIELVDPTGDVR